MIVEQYVPPLTVTTPNPAFEELVDRRAHGLCTSAEPNHRRADAGLPCMSHRAEARTQLWDLRQRQEDNRDRSARTL